MSDNEPLFQNMDEQERLYAPQQVPGTALPPEEVDSGGSAGQGTGLAAGRGDDVNSTGERDHVAGADGDPGTVPVVPVRPDTSVAAPIAVPATTAAQDRAVGDDTDS